MAAVDYVVTSAVNSAVTSTITTALTEFQNKYDVKIQSQCSMMRNQSAGKQPTSLIDERPIFCTSKQ